MMREAKAVERRLRQRIRSLLRASPALWADYKKARRTNQPSLATVLGVIFVLCTGGPILFGGVPILLAQMLERKGGLDLVLAGFCLPGLGATLLVVGEVLRVLWHSTERNLYLHLPVRDGVIVRLALLRTIAASTIWFFIGLWPFGFVAWRLKLSLAQWLMALLFCFGQWAVIVAAGVLIAYYWPKSWYTRVGATLMLWGPFLLPFSPAALAPALAGLIYIVTPGGWFAAAWLRGWLQADPWGWLGLFPTLLLLLESWRVYGEWFDSHSAAEPSVVPAIAKPAGDSADPRPGFSWREWRDWVFGDCAVDEYVAQSTHAIVSEIRSRDFLRPDTLFATNAFEGLYQRLLTLRERFLAEWLAGDWWAANKPCARMMFAAACFMTLSVLGGRRFPCFGLLSFIFVLMLFTDRWRGFATVRSGGGALPHFSAFPVGGAEIANLALKSSLIYGARLAPGLALAAVYDHVFLGVVAVWLCACALVALTIALAAATMRPLLYLSLTTGLWAMPWRRAHWTIAVLALVVITIVSALADIALLGLPANPLVVQATVAVGGVVLLSAYLFRRLCLFLDGRGYFDLTVDPRLAMFDRQDQRELLEARHRNRAERRRQYGPFWWLPKHMLRAKSGAAWDA